MFRRGLCREDAGPVDNTRIVRCIDAAQQLRISRSLLRRLESYSSFPLEALEAVVEIRRCLAEIETSAVESAREKGATWDDIASAMGVSRQAMYQKYRRNGDGAGPRS